ncbi:LOW QUALITY PROTEIN: hypothetical protein PHMEG_0001310 [Phytophthora megakarya]|uniref:Formin like protein n=1 Tax=Phytophthora megakarya TaxID=4795 RepID=A0A225X1Z9_9STRA|nr:LOW QUALITY PROTEIN: hypothetical protein PHMEG_0001310 [Phytophthora megakarya]
MSTAASFLLQASPWVSLEIRRGSVADIPIPIPAVASQEDGPQECLVWQFELQEHDVGFQLLENGAVVRDLGRFKARDGEADANANATVETHPLQLDAQEPTMEGRYDGVKADSVYTLRWDNSYSLVRHKQVQYRFLVTSNRVVAAAELAVQESQTRSQKRARRAAAGLPLPHLAKTLAKERAMTDEERKVENEQVAANFEQTVMDVVSIFMTKPDSPLHEGAVRPLMLALEAVLCNGIKEEFLDMWPEAPFYEFLLETQHVLRDDMGIVAAVQAGKPPSNLQYLGWNRSRLLETQHVLRDDMGIVAEVQAGKPPSNLQHLGWNRSRSFLFLALNKGILQRAFENLIKRRMVVEKYYERRALLYKYEDARRIASFLSALNGVTFLLAEYPSDECDEEDEAQFPLNLKMCAPEAPLVGNEISLEDGVEVVLRNLLKGILTKSSILNIALCLEMPSMDNHFKILLLGKDVTKPLLVSASNEWVEIIMRFKSNPKDNLVLKLDNSYSMVRSKLVQIRHTTVSKFAYTTAWEGCLEMARSISWNHASRAGSERCAKFMVSQHQKEEAEMKLQRRLDDDDESQDKDDGIMGFRTSLISNPVSYIGGLLSTDGDAEACDHVLDITCKYTDKTPSSKFAMDALSKKKTKRSKGTGTGEGGERAEYAALRKNPAMDKYFKMLSFGVPPSGVAQKMTQDEIPPDKIAIFAAGPDGSNASSFARKHRKREHSDSRGLNRRDSTFRKVYWTNLETKKANETIWARVTARRKTAPITLSPQDFQELEYLFGNATTSSPSQSKEKVAKRTKFSALDSRRSNNISIGLNQFKGAGGAAAISSALKDCDFEFLTVDSLTNLQDIAPNSVEVKRYTNFRGSRSRLEPSEKFLVEMCEIPRVTEKINAMLFASQFGYQQQELRNRMQVITQACYEVLRSERLARCFELVLAIGNLLNTGTELEGAQGITLASLLKLSETKAIDQSMTLLQFIIKLIHDRGEGDVLLFINDLSTLAEARRFSNVICDSQARSLQHEITKLEQEIKEDMVEDLKQFHKSETLRKRRFEEQKRHHSTFTSKQPHTLQSNGIPNNSRSAMLDAIRLRRANGVIDKGNQEAVRPTSNNPHTAVLAAIRSRGEIIDTNAPEENPRVSLLPAICSKRTAGKESASFETEENDTTPSPPATMLNVIPNQQRRLSDDVNRNQDDSVSSKESEASNARASLLAAIRQREQSMSTPDDDSVDARSALLSSIKQQGSDSGGLDQSRLPSRDGNSQSALLAAIRQRPSQVKQEMTDVGDDCNTEGEFEPRQYKMESKFIIVMRERLMNIKVVYEDIEMELETLHSVWEGTARYLAEDSSGSSTEYVFGLLNRFLLDVKVAKTLLFRKGLSFTSEANSLLPHAYVGSIVATKFGSGVITALRVADKRIEVKFPWSKEAYLAPSSILSAGCMVRSHRWGVGIIRETCYDVGFCDVRFSFGYGKIRVEELVLETSSNHDELRHELLRGGFLIGDPVITPFGCGHVQSMRGKPQGPTSMISVGLLESDPNIYGGERVCSAIAFMPASHVKRNY